MMLRLTAASRACLLDRTQPGSLAHDALEGAPVIRRDGDPPAGLYEVDCSDTDCQELMTVAKQYCPDAVAEIQTALKPPPR